MPWTTPRTYVAGEMMTAAIFNTDHRDNVGEVYRIRQIVGAGGSAGAQSYPGFPLWFKLSGGAGSTSGSGGHGGGVYLREGTTILATLMHWFDSGTGNQQWWTDGSFYMDPGPVGVHEYNTQYTSTGSGYGAGGGELQIWERCFD